MSRGLPAANESREDVLRSRHALVLLFVLRSVPVLGSFGLLVLLERLEVCHLPRPVSEQCSTPIRAWTRLRRTK